LEMAPRHWNPFGFLTKKQKTETIFQWL